MAELDLTGFETGNYDFGFSAVDEAQVPESEQQQPPAPALDTSEITEKLDAIIAKQTEGDAGELTALLALKMKEVENLTLPLLYNFLKDADKAYIHWPNRAPIIKAQIEKILKVTRP